MPAHLRSPWPHDLLWNGTGLALGSPDPKNPGQMVISKPVDLSSVVPPSFGYDALPPTVEAVYSYEQLIGGMGQRLHTETHPGPSQAPNRYYYAPSVDASCGTPWMLGPSITNMTPATTDATNGVTGFFEIGGSVYA